MVPYLISVSYTKKWKPLILRAIDSISLSDVGKKSWVRKQLSSEKYGQKEPQNGTCGGLEENYQKSRLQIKFWPRKKACEVL